MAWRVAVVSAALAASAEGFQPSSSFIARGAKPTAMSMSSRSCALSSLFRVHSEQLGETGREYTCGLTSNYWRV